MAAPASQPSSNGVGSPDHSDDKLLDGEQLRKLSIPSPPRNSLENWDAMSGSLDSPRSSISTSSIDSPNPSSSNMSRSQSGKLKPKRVHSSYYDEETGTWKCRNCGGTYDVPNPGSRQRREHKKACEETQKLQAIKRAEEEQARREQARKDEADREAALRDQGSKEAANLPKSPIGKTVDHQLQNNHHQQGSKVTNDPNIIGAFIATPAIPEREEVNFEAPKELIHDIERDSAGHLQETRPVNAQTQGGEINSKPPRREETLEGRYLSSEKHLRAEGQVPDGTNGSPLRNELSGELKAVNGSSTPTSSKVHANGNLDHLWKYKPNPPAKTQNSQNSGELEQVKYCSSAASRNEAHLDGTVYDRLVDLHDNSQVAVTRSVSLRGREETARSLIREMDAAVGNNYTRSLSLDHYGVGVTMERDHSSRDAKLDYGAETAMLENDTRDLSSDQLIEVLIGKDHTKAPSLNHGVEMKQKHSSPLANGISDSRIGYSPTSVPSVASRRLQSDSPGTVASRRAQQSDRPQAAASPSKQFQKDRPGNGANDRNQSDSPEEDDTLGAIIARNVGKFWMHAVSIGAVAVIAWVGKSLTDRQQGRRREAPRCRRAHCSVSRCYWDDE